MNKIVVGYDGSDGSKRALERAAMLAGDGSRLVVVGAAETRAHTGITEGARLDFGDVEGRRRDLEEAKAFLSERGVEAETVDGQGDAGDVILDVAEDADLVIVGSRGLNPLQRLLMGSVSSKVVARAPCDVLVVR